MCIDNVSQSVNGMTLFTLAALAGVSLSAMNVLMRAEREKQFC